MEICKMETTTNTTDKAFRASNRFIGKPSPFLIDGDVQFTTNAEFKSGEYYFQFGPSFAHTGRANRVDAIGIRGAVRRATAVREPDIPGLHEELEANQDRIFEVYSETISIWLNHFHGELKTIVEAVEDPVALFHTWVATGPKKLLKKRAFIDIVHNGRALHPTFVKQVEYKCKSGEILEPDKYLRAIGDLTTPGSIMCGFYMDMVKDAFAKGFQFLDGIATFVKPKMETLREVFVKLISPVKFVQFYFFSDDACIAVRCKDGIMRANLDIKMCDGSNFHRVFELLKTAMKVLPFWTPYIDGAFAQLESNMVIHNPEDYQESVTLIPNGPFLFSGSTLTTVVNNMANTLIFMAIMNTLTSEMTMQQAIVAIRQAARTVGYIIKVDVCASIHDLQFLKHSPAVNLDGEIDAYLNLGVWLRKFGRCKGEMPSRKGESLALRIAKYNSEVVRSRVEAGNHCLHDAFLTKVISVDDRFAAFVAKDKSFTEDVSGRQLGYIPVNELCNRYRVSTEAMEHFCSLIRGSQPGQLISHPVARAIMEKDYGYQ